VLPEKAILHISTQCFRNLIKTWSGRTVSLNVASMTHSFPSQSGGMSTCRHVSCHRFSVLSARRNIKSTYFFCPQWKSTACALSSRVELCSRQFSPVAIVVHFYVGVQSCCEHSLHHRTKRTSSYVILPRGLFHPISRKKLEFFYLSRWKQQGPQRKTLYQETIQN
jgi:hypothetical protein